MSILLSIALGLAAIVALLVIVGVTLPRNHRAASRLVLAYPPDSVWAVIRDLQGVASWWPEVRSAERLPDQVGQERVRQMLGNNFAMTLLVAESEPPRRLRTVIDAPPGAAFGGAWIYELTPAGAGTEVRITEEGWVANPFFRLIARLMGYHRTLDSYLASLARHFGEAASPEHIP
jgi:uncharacterized protein YndB with AHSA1/START domain